MDGDVYNKIADKLRAGKVLALIHSNADPDAVGSAFAIKAAFPGVTIAAPDDVSRGGKALLGALEIEVNAKPELGCYDTILVVDTATPSMLGKFGEALSGTNPIVIDHHATNGWNSPHSLIDAGKSSCAEVVYEFLKHLKCKVEGKSALALLAGILADTGHFRHANTDSLRTFLEILEKSGLSISDVTGVLEVEEDPSKRIAALKGAQRLRFENAGRFILAYTRISSFEAFVCQKLLAVGADGALVGSQRKNEFRISGRLRSKLSELGVDLGRVFVAVGEELGCEGGGHPAAAGLSGEGDVEAALNICVARLKEEVKKKLAEKRDA